MGSRERNTKENNFFHELDITTQATTQAMPPTNYDAHVFDFGSCFAYNHPTKHKLEI